MAKAPALEVVGRGKSGLARPDHCDVGGGGIHSPMIAGHGIRHMMAGAP